MRLKQPTMRAVVGSLLLVTFVAGASAGVLGDRLIAKPAVGLRVTMDEMSGVLDRLDLTPAQRSRAGMTIARTAPRTRAIMLEAAERLRLVADSVDRELRDILTPEQQVRLDSLRRGPRLLLKRKIVTPGGTTVDTLLDTSVPTRRVQPKP